MNRPSPRSFPVDVHRRLSSKIIVLLLTFFATAALAIGTTLYVSWQLEGSGATINDAGSQRMRSYRLGMLASGGIDESEPGQAATAAIAEEMSTFEEVMDHLEHGNPERGIAPPRNPEAVARIAAIRADWKENGRPLLDTYLAASQAPARARAAENYRQWLSGFAPEIDGLVRLIEHENTVATALLHSAQVGLLALALLATVILIRFFFVLVFRPLDQLYDGMCCVAEDDFSIRLKTETNDEFGVVTIGFNRMVTHLQQLYNRLEEMVAAKTSSLAARNHELKLLYEVTAFLNEPASIDVLCQGFMERVKVATGASAASIRLCSDDGNELFLVAHDGVSSQFVACEQVISRGECACGHALNSKIPVVINTLPRPPILTRNACVNESIRTVAAFTISHDKKVLGVFNLYFTTERALTEPETCLLETLGQHLGVAVENQRLRARDRELAISEERNLLAQELHDSIAQGLAFLNIQVQMLQDSLDHQRCDEVQGTVDQIREGIHESYEDVRELLVQFRTRIGQADLDTAIRNSLERFERQTGIPTRMNSAGKTVAMAPDAQLQVIHIVQESLSNIRKHAAASHVDVSIRKDIDRTVIEIADDGVGFVPDHSDGQEEREGRHIGLKIMQERAHRVGGRCQIVSTPGKGTRVMLTL